VNRVDVGVGVVTGVVGFYGLTLASAFWVALLQPIDQLWAVTLSGAVCLGLGIVTAWRPRAAVVAAAVMTILVVTGFAAGSEDYQWRAPFPTDLIPLLFHGGRSPLVIGPTLLIGAAAVWRLTTDRRRPG
jgi:hypothetical protein